MAVSGFLFLPRPFLFRDDLLKRLDVGVECGQRLGQFLLYLGVGGILGQRVGERLQGVGQDIERGGKVRQ